MIVDTHIHTLFSSDSKMTINQALQKANELGVAITVTEHMDLAYPEPDAFVFDITDYFNEYEKYRSENLYLGIELGMRQDCIADNSTIVMNNQFDYVIGSIHVIDNIDIYNEDFYHMRSKQEVYHQYFDSMISCLKTYDFIDSLGHIDYIARYARFENPEIYYNEYSEKIDKVLKILAQNQKAIEINTRRIADPATLEALIPIYKRFYALGGRIATAGSDAHKPEDIGKNFNIAMNIAEMCNLKLVYFENRVPHFIK
ncbi:histidinol phosphate phosphatase [Dendrosporobacter sp. 1207_IL3150]|uniref:histidinol phosphate phosphatase n=1 Tax=Dendrosporobacter sp. 1207_IL3150 TaxID=3084054 RepID=UPI002FDB27F8